ILPLLHALGYTAGGLNQILRSKTLVHPFVNIGSQKRKISLIPDYLLVVENKTAWVLDAKSPNEEIKSGSNVEQVFSYAIHPDVRVNRYALCNGREFIAFQIDQTQPILYFHLSEINQHLYKVYELLSPQAFKPGQLTVAEREAFDYAALKPLAEIKDLKRQSAKRHFGVHPYFTKQVWNVVQEYIKNFTQPGDTVLDPFGGSGVTFVEALILGRKAIHIDLNPLSIFLVKNLILPANIKKLTDEFAAIKKQFKQYAPQTEKEIEQALATYPYPKGIKLPKNSDVPTIEQLFSPHQLAQLAYLKHLIKQVQGDDIQGTLLLMFSGLLNKINLTYHASKVRSEGGGNSSVFAYYRYRIAKNPAILDVMQYFELRLSKVIAAKKEIAPLIHPGTIQNAQIYKGTATELHIIADGSVDYIYTDPPYGKKIQYLDLSILWNAWLDLPVSPQDYELEAIEGGELGKSKADYSALLAQSIEEMYRVLKFDRWMSFVFAHKDPAYWHLIVETAEKAGFEYMGAVKQSNDKTTFKKRQHPFTVLSGQLIINFKKVKTPKAIMKVGLGADIASIVMETIEGVIAQNDGATLEEINNELIIKGLELGFLDILSREYQDITPLLTSHFTYDAKTHKFHIPHANTFKSRIDIRLRIRYFLISYLRRMEHQHEYPTFDEIILHIMPLLRNGITPEEQTILGILEEIADRTGDERWKLKGGQQLSFLQVV
ncbi:type I restriction enzyme HsdR N-terminal domain-containing protein, partial [Candidatus Poribacteria bacterium]|nr:type I restriction enzyme HsdR N-terminal domain-containing protein [Candidatus Poribacteria bacterium]